MKFQEFNRVDNKSSESLLSLFLKAMIGSFRLGFYLIEYLLTWFVMYPVLMFASFYLLKIFINTPVKNVNVFFWLTLIITQGSIFYFGHKIVVRFINTERNSEEYFFQRYQTRFELFVFILINAACYYLTNIDVLQKLKNDSELLVDFAIFYLIYMVIVWRTKKWKV
jgi:hypothetical protein